MSKNNKVKNFKNISSNLDINKLYQLQEYLIVSQDFFKYLESYINKYVDSFDSNSEYEFTEKVINLYNDMKIKLEVK